MKTGLSFLNDTVFTSFVKKKAFFDFLIGKIASRFAFGITRHSVHIDLLSKMQILFVTES
jgi:hypothetical protein